MKNPTENSSKPEDNQCLTYNEIEMIEKLSNKYASFLSCAGKCPIKEGDLSESAWLATFGINRLVAHIRFSLPNVMMSQPEDGSSRSL
jgi:hypothetical protein